MTDLISRSAAIQALKKAKELASEPPTHFDIYIHKTFDLCIRLIAAFDAIDAVPVVHGEFARLPEEVIPCLHVDPVLCKTCNTTFFTFNKEGKRLMLCPYCGALYSGARMDGESEEDNNGSQTD